MDAVSLVDLACERPGSTTSATASYREGLERLRGAATHEAQLSELGTAAIEAQIVTEPHEPAARHRLGGRAPRGLEQRTERPIIVLGLPRTGTTLLSELLHRDPANRSLMRWEALDSVPPPEAATFTTDPRIDATRASAEMMDTLNPGFSAIHYEAPDGPTECVAVLAQDFKSLLWECVANVPSYGEWLLVVRRGLRVRVPP